MDTRERAVVRGQTQWMPADRIAAYARWRENGSLVKTAEATGIPVETVKQWCRREGWVARAKQEEALEQEVALQRAYMRIVGEVDPLIDRLLQIAQTGNKEQATQLQAVKHALAVVGIAPVERKVVTGRQATDAPGPSSLSDDQMSAIEALFREGTPEPT